MKQILQDLNSGNTFLEVVPIPKVKKGHILIKTTRSLISKGTEKMLVDFGKSSILNKIKSQPEKVNQVLDKIKTDGISQTIKTVNRKLNTPIPLGYSNCGLVVEIADDVTDFKVGDRVVSNGNHAEYVSVSKNLAAIIPDEISDEHACFTVIGSIGLQGIRLLKPMYGETYIVLGLGLIGLISIQILKSNGCNVIGFDIDDEKIKIANALGIESYNSEKIDVIQFSNNLTNNHGVDGVLITASSKSNQLVKTASQACRKRGKIVLTGVIGLNLDRSDFYEKEISFQVSCSYGPGRYDKSYEIDGVDYPLPFVRWTTKRNFETILNSLKKNEINVEPLITKKFKLNDYINAYKSLNDNRSIASIIEYENSVTNNSINSELRVVNIDNLKNISGFNLALIGSGNFASATILPSLSKLKAKIKYISSLNGLSSTLLAKKYSINFSTTETKKIFNDKDVMGVIISTRHDLHAKLIIESLNNNKNVFVEKPLCLNQTQLKEIISAKNKSNSSISVGFNRRFSPHSIKIKKFLGENPGPINIIANVNAGFVPEDSWIHDMSSGGGRIVGEACHFIDLISFFTGSDVSEVSMNALGIKPEINTDNASIHLKYKNGSLGVINYFSNGNSSYPKERIEIHYQKMTFIIDNFRKLYSYGKGNKFTNLILKTKQDKGHKNQFKSLLDYWNKSTKPLIPFNSIVNTTNTTFLALKSLQEGRTIKI